ncbi:MAG: hypothetical protein AAF628_12350 [Planctomycetota bacterium]
MSRRSFTPILIGLAAALLAVACSPALEAEGRYRRAPPPPDAPSAWATAADRARRDWRVEMDLTADGAASMMFWLDADATPITRSGTWRRLDAEGIELEFSREDGAALAEPLVQPARLTPDGLELRLPGSPTLWLTKE